MQKIQDLHVITTEALVAPRLLKEQLAIDESIARTVVEARQTVRRIIRGEDPRLLSSSGRARSTIRPPRWNMPGAWLACALSSGNGC